jgi:predicted HD phosphohydrolase
MSSSVVASLTSLYSAAGAHTYGVSQAGADLAAAASSSAAASEDLRGDGPTGVSFLAHALQCAAQALAAHPDDDELAVAALLHDIGWLLPKPSERAQLTGAAASADAASATADAVFIARHDATGAAHLASLGFPARVCALVAGHVAAKRFLVATEPAYAAALSRGSTWTLAQQGGPMTPAEVSAFRAGADADAMLALRRWDEAAKVPGLAVPDWGAHVPRLEAVLARARWAGFDSPALPPSRALAAVAPDAAASPLGANGPGFAVVRGWLSADELAAVREFADALPAAPADAVFHTLERDGAGAVVPARTEHFAQLADAQGVGAFLRAGRLRDLCSALREGRPMALYKEKLNYKLKGSTGGYKPHVDFYAKMDAQTLAREFLLDDSDVCVCMLAVDDMDEGNGCPWVAPGWHTDGPKVFRGAVESLSLGDRKDVAEVPVVDPATVPWVPVHLAAGDVLIYGNNMPHYSEANTSERDRRALFAVYSDARHGEQRTAYYAAEAVGRRANGSGRESGKPKCGSVTRTTHTKSLLI